MKKLFFENFYDGKVSCGHIQSYLETSNTKKQEEKLPRTLYFQKCSRSANSQFQSNAISSSTPVVSVLI